MNWIFLINCAVSGFGFGFNLGLFLDSKKDKSNYLTNLLLFLMINILGYFI